MRLAHPLRLAAFAAALTLAACGGNKDENATDTMMPAGDAAGSTGTAGTMPMDSTNMGTGTGTMTGTGTATGTATGTGTAGRP